MSNYVYLVQMDIPAELENDFNRIYDTQHVPNILAVPGAHKCTRYQFESGDVDGVARYLAIYEIDSEKALDTPEFQSRRGWAHLKPYVRNPQIFLYRKITEMDE